MFKPVEKCFACERNLGRKPALVTTLDGQQTFVGRECYKKIKDAGYPGWQPPTGGPRLYLIGNVLHDESEGRIREDVQT